MRKDFINDDVFVGAGFLDKMKAGFTKAKTALPAGTYQMPGLTITKAGPQAPVVVSEPAAVGAGIGGILKSPLVWAGAGLLALLFFMKK
jgi:hypothetical protein